MSRPGSNRRTALARLARLHHIQTAYYDIDGRRRQAQPEALVAILRALGVEIESPGDLSAALRARTAELARELVEPVVVAWNGRLEAIEAQLPAAAAGPITCRLVLENGETSTWQLDARRARTVASHIVDGQRIVSKRIAIRRTVPTGYHRLTLDTRHHTSESLVIASPSRVFQRDMRTWGVFLPLYALRTTDSWGCGDLSDLEGLQAWTAELGGSVVATLPFLATFAGEGVFEPSPYAPASRLFWNELFVDPRRTAEFDTADDARRLVGSSGFQADVARLEAAPLVDYREAMRLRRSALEPLARVLAASRGPRREAFERWMAAHPGVEPYARFRAVVERRREPWPSWPEPLRSGRLSVDDGEGQAERYHAYVQWVADEQVRRAADRACAWGPGLYLDVPLGVHPHGYDVWRYRDLFAHTVSAGAPPDPFFTRGQNWAFPPLHPDAVRRDGYRYPIACLRHQLASAGLLRLDHVMGLHRLFWIPPGCDPTQGAYVRYRAEEWYALLSLESHRSRTSIVGENLGTVPAYVNAAMARHGLRQMYVVQFAVNPDGPRALRPVPHGAVASLNTHDMPTFAAFLRGLDVEDRQRLGLLTERGARAARRRIGRIRRALDRFLPQVDRTRLPSLAASDEETRLLLRSLSWLASSRAGLTLVNLEDLWQETAPQNRPGTGPEEPNWRRKAAYAFETFRALPQVETILRHLTSRIRRPPVPSERPGH